MNKIKAIVIGLLFGGVAITAAPAFATVVTTGATWPSNTTTLQDYSGTLYVGDGSILTNGGTGTLEVNASADGNGYTSVTVGGLDVGSDGGNGTVRVIGDASADYVPEDVSASINVGNYGLYVGTGATGTLNISAGGVVEVNENNAYLGADGLDGTAGNATVNIDGLGSSLRVIQTSTSNPYYRKGGQIYVGFNGLTTTTVNITNGGTMEAVSSDLGDGLEDGSIYIGSDTRGSVATVNVTGANSQLIADTYLSVGQGDAGTSARLNLIDGGVAVVNSSNALGISTVGGDATVDVTGAGSFLMAEEIQVGGYSKALWGYTAEGVPVTSIDWDSVVEGQQVKDESGNLIYYPDGTPVIGVPDPDLSSYIVPSSTLEGNKIYLKTTGSLIVENGAEVQATTINVSSNADIQTYNGEKSVLTVRNDGLVHGDVNVFKDGILNGNGYIKGDVMVDGGTIAPGNSPGTIHIDGDLTVNSGNLEIEIDSPSLYDMFDVSGTILFGKDAEIDLILGYVPDSAIDFESFFEGYTEMIFDELFDPLTNINILLDDVASYAIELIFGGQVYTYTEKGAFAGSGLAAVPEPSTILLLGAGLAGLVVFSWRQKRA